MSTEREELIRIVEELDDAEVRVVLAEVKDRWRSRDKGAWPPAFFGSGTAGRDDTASRADEILAEGFGR